MADLSQEDWAKQSANNNNAVILDVRTQDEVEQGVIPNAIHVDIHLGQGFIDELETMDKDKTYYVYCRSGARSAQACAIMEQLGFNKAYNLLGGIMNWQGKISSI